MPAKRRRIIRICGYCAESFETGGRAGAWGRRFCSRRCAAILKNKSGLLGQRLVDGYVWLAMAGHPLAVKGYVPEHRLIAYRALGRPLGRDEVVHHINCDRSDNRSCNLLICSRSYHRWLHEEMSRRYAHEHFGEGA